MHNCDKIKKEKNMLYYCLLDSDVKNLMQLHSGLPHDRAKQALSGEVDGLVLLRMPVCGVCILLLYVYNPVVHGKF